VLLTVLSGEYVTASTIKASIAKKTNIPNNVILVIKPILLDHYTLLNIIQISVCLQEYQGVQYLPYY